MVVGLYTHLWQAARSLKFHSQGGIHHWIEHNPDDTYPFKVVNGIPVRRGDEIVRKEGV